jgi:hypothetical protein
MKMVVELGAEEPDLPEHPGGGEGADINMHLLNEIDNAEPPGRQNKKTSQSS